MQHFLFMNVARSQIPRTQIRALLIAFLITKRCVEYVCMTLNFAVSAIYYEPNHIMDVFLLENTFLLSIGRQMPGVGHALPQ